MAMLEGISDWAAVAGLLIIALPVIIVGGAAAAGVAILLGALYLFVVKGIPWALDFFKERHSGAVAKKYESAADGSRRWNR